MRIHPDSIPTVDPTDVTVLHVAGCDDCEWEIEVVESTEAYDWREAHEYAAGHETWGAVRFLDCPFCGDRHTPSEPHHAEYIASYLRQQLGG